MENEILEWLYCSLCATHKQPAQAFLFLTTFHLLLKVAASEKRRFGAEGQFNVLLPLLRTSYCYEVATFTGGDVSCGWLGDSRPACEEIRM